MAKYTNRKKGRSNLLRAGAVCSFLGALTTALLMTLPYPEAADFESRVLLYENSLYLGRLWILFLHPQVNLLAALAIAYLLFRKYPLQVAFGMVFLAVWAYTEMSQQALLIDALNQIWRPGYLDAGTEPAKNMYTTLIHAASGISDSQYFLVIYGFGIGTFLYGLAFVQEPGLGRWIGVSLLFIGVLSLASFSRYYLGAGALNNIVNGTYKWIYTYLQPLVRIAMGIWIFRAVGSGPGRG